MLVAYVNISCPNCSTICCHRFPNALMNSGRTWPKIGLLRIQEALPCAHTLIQSASRSPPGLDPDHAKFFPVPPIFLPKMLKKQNGMPAFFRTLLETFSTSGTICSVIFAPWSHFGGAMGSFLGSKNGLGHQTCPKIAPRGVFPVISSPFWKPFGVMFSYFCIFCLKRGVLKYVLFSSIFGSP